MTSVVSTALSNAITVTLLAPVVCFGCRQSRCAPLTHAMWIVLLVKLLTPPLLIVPVSVPWFQLDDGIWLGLQAVWGAGICVMASLFFKQLWTHHQILSTGSTANVAASRELKEISQRLGVQNPPQLRLFEGRLSPLLWGWGFRNAIVFPKSLWDRLSVEERGSLLTHELAHHIRGDHYVRVLEIVCLCLYWWHPVVWCARGRIEEAEEACCDAFVVRHEPARTYANAIMATLDFMSETRCRKVALASQLATASLQKRLTAVMLRSQSERLSRLGWWTLLAFCLLLLPFHPVFF